MRTVIVGCGRVGSNLARWLSEEGDEVAVVDSSEAAFNRLGEEFAGSGASIRCGHQCRHHKHHGGSTGPA